MGFQTLSDNLTSTLFEAYSEALRLFRLTIALCQKRIGFSFILDHIVGTMVQMLKAQAKSPGSTFAASQSNVTMRQTTLAFQILAHILHRLLRNATAYFY